MTDAPPTPVGGPEPAPALGRWLRWPRVLVPAALLAGLLAGAVLAFPELLARLQLHDYQEAEQHIQGFAWPEGLTDDPTLTACGGFGLRCARTGLAPEAAVRAVVPGLSPAGVDLGEVRCGARAETSEALAEPQPWDCTAVSHRGGFSVVVRATDRTLDPGAEVAGLPLGYTYVALVVVAENERLDALVNETVRPLLGPPLPLRAADIPGLPSILAPLTCTDPVADGCRGFEGTITLSDARAADLDATAARLADELRAGGYFVEMEHCRGAGIGRRCFVNAMAFRSPGASDFMGITALLSVDEVGRLSVEARVSVGTPIGL